MAFAEAHDFLLLMKKQKKMDTFLPIFFVTMPFLGNKLSFFPTHQTEKAKHKHVRGPEDHTNTGGSRKSPTMPFDPVILPCGTRRAYRYAAAVSLPR